MKLYFSATSPFVRKVLVCAHERGLADQIENLEEADVASANPLSKVPALVTDEGEVIIDSFVICDYLEGLGEGPALIPTEGAARNAVLRLHALADGVMVAGVASVTEGRRPEDKQWSGAFERQMAKIEGALAVLEARVAGFGERVDLATISTGAALGYLDLRFASLDWRSVHPGLARWYEAFAQRPSMLATVPPS